jgi:hypothetical protein
VGSGGTIAEAVIAARKVFEYVNGSVLWWVPDALNIAVAANIFDST